MLKQENDAFLRRSIEKIHGIDTGCYEIGTGLIIEHDGDLLFAIQKRKRWVYDGNMLVAGIVGVGGKLEPNESIFKCIEREAMEEIGCEIELIDSPEHFALKNEEIEELDIDYVKGTPRPHFTILLKNEFSMIKPYILIYGYLANIIGTPEPLDLGGIIFAPKSEISVLRDTEITIDKMKKHNFRVIQKEDITQNIYFRPSGTVDFYLKLLQSKGYKYISYR